ncbi:MAG TPA: hypothetical protein VE029_05870 [Rhizobacter sp.]|nr:hypothetical protein [Rhizobacter sp.]
MTADAGDELVRLRAENARLVGLLDTHGIAWRVPESPTAPVAAVPLTTDEKVALFRRLFRGRTDVYPVRWENKAGKTGYSPACANEWRAGICEKPRIKCTDCANRLLVPLTDQTIYEVHCKLWRWYPATCRLAWPLPRAPASRTCSGILPAIPVARSPSLTKSPAPPRKATKCWF